MIPKIIHYCWVGGAPKPESVLYCIDSWKRFCPDYEIIEWNESNYDFKKCKYMSDAYDAEKWGFVPDYARLDIVYQHGGIYLDTDVEIIRSFDEILKHKAFFGFEDPDGDECFINCGQGFGAEPLHSVIKALRDTYDNVAFFYPDGSLNLLPSPHYTTAGLVEMGLIRNNQDQNLDGVMVFASDVLCPKNFVSGVIKKTQRTVSIHHFTASWMDERIRKDIEHSQIIKNRFGELLGGKFLIAESAIEKYGILGSLKRPFTKIADHTYGYKHLIQAHFKKEKMNKNEGIAILDTSLDSENLGDSIIMDYCEKQLSDVLSLKGVCHLHTHVQPTLDEVSSLQKVALRILCGTNLLSGHMRSYGLWKLPQSLDGYKNIISMGVGFDSESMDYDLYSQLLLRTILSKKMLLSVRDSFTEQKLHKMGIKNAINTSCPTMWNLTPEHCKEIPTDKCEVVICTLTDYNKDTVTDAKLLELLIKEYRKVYFWPQGAGDYEYICELGYSERVEIVERSLKAYDEVLQNNSIDYVGTRLHAGIRALNFKRRAIIISIDNRAKSISKDTDLPVIERDSIGYELEKKINSEFTTAITLPQHNIDLWKMQFIN